MRALPATALRGRSHRSRCRGAVLATPESGVSKAARGKTLFFFFFAFKGKRQPKRLCWSGCRPGLGGVGLPGAGTGGAPNPRDVCNPRSSQAAGKLCWTPGRPDAWAGPSGSVFTIFHSDLRTCSGRLLAEHFCSSFSILSRASLATLLSCGSPPPYPQCWGILFTLTVSTPALSVQMPPRQPFECLSS